MKSVSHYTIGQARHSLKLYYSGVSWVWKNKLLKNGISKLYLLKELSMLNVNTNIYFTYWKRQISTDKNLKNKPYCKSQDYKKCKTWYILIFRECCYDKTI